MSRNNIALSIDDLPGGRFKVRWREDVVTDGVRERKARSQVVSDKGARDALVGKLRRTLETGEVYEPSARVVTTAGDLERAAVDWLLWQKSRDRKQSTRETYKGDLERIMGTIRRVRRIPSKTVIPVTVLDVGLFTSILNHWAEEDAARNAPNGRAASPDRRYTLSTRLYRVWSFAHSQPDKYPRVPPLVDRGLVIPPPSGKAGAPEAPTWAECDVIVRLGYQRSVDLGDLLATERLTGLRVQQVVGIRRRAVDPVNGMLTVEIGKSKAEEQERRTIPVPRSLMDLWHARLGACSNPNDFLFPAPNNKSGHVEPPTKTIATLWQQAEAAALVRPNLYQPLNRRKGRPNHAFRAAYMAGLQAMTVEINGSPVQQVADRTIDFLVGHRADDTRARHYAPATKEALKAAVRLVAAVDLKGTKVGAENVVQGPW